MPIRHEGVEDGVREFLGSLPEGVRTRVESLRGVQARCDEVKDAYVREKRALEEKYRGLYGPLLAERRRVVIGEGDDAAADGTEGQKGVPGFWRKVLKSAEMVGEHVTRRDEDVLEHLLDVRSEPIDESTPGFKLVFQFAPNPFFTQTTLEKRYFMGEDDSILEKTEATEIDWLPGKNPAIRVIKKKPKRRGGPPRVKTVRSHSFFDFFSTPEAHDAGEMEAIADLADLLVEDDFEMGCYVKDMVIPHAVSWYTGELAEERDPEGTQIAAGHDEDEDDDGDDDDDDDDDEEK